MNDEETYFLTDEGAKNLSKIICLMRDDLSFVEILDNDIRNQWCEDNYQRIECLQNVSVSAEECLKAFVIYALRPIESALRLGLI